MTNKKDNLKEKEIKKEKAIEKNKLKEVSGGIKDHYCCLPPSKIIDDSDSGNDK